MTTMTSKQVAEMIEKMRSYNATPEAIAAAITALIKAGVKFSDK
jgi:hypothetical protein